MKTKLLVGMLLAGSSLFAAPRVSVGIGVGGFGFGYVAPAPVVAYAAPCPGPGYAWIGGRWVPPVYGRAYVAAPRFEGNRYYGRFDRNVGHYRR
jgi:hypothetical protein